MLKRRLCLAVLCASLLLLPKMGICAEPKAPYKVLTAPEVKQMQESGNVLLVHVLSRIEYDVQHIKGSINIPVTEIKTTTRLPKDKNKPIIFYCMGTR